MKLAPLVLFVVLISSSFVLASHCPNSSVENNEPALKMKSKSGMNLMVCGYQEKEKPVDPQRLQMNEFKVYWQKDQETPKELFSASALEEFWVSQKKDKLTLEELWWIDGKFFPALVYQFGCDQKQCRLDSVSCILKLGRKKKSDLMKNLKNRMQMKDRGESPEIEAMLAQAFALALKGDKEAQDFFVKNNRPSRLDGHLGEEWEASKVKIEKALRYKCI